MAYQIRLYIGEKIQDFSLEGKTTFVIGSGDDADCQLTNQGIIKNCLIFFYSEAAWNVKSDDPSILKHPKKIQDGDIYVLSRTEKIAVNVYIKGNNEVRYEENPLADMVIIGRGSHCTMVLPENKISREHAFVVKRNGQFFLKDNKSTNGTYLNSEKITEEKLLREGDVIDIGSFHILFSHDELSIMKEQEIHEEEKTEYPFWVQRAPRLRKEFPSEEINITAPPSEPIEPESDLLSILGTPIVTVICMIIMAVSMASPYMLILTVPMTAMSIYLNIRNRKRQKKNYTEKDLNRKVKYTSYLVKIQARIDEAGKKQRDALKLDYPSPRECIYTVSKKTENLWNRNVFDDDFMTLRLGIGDVPASFTVKGKPDDFQLTDDEFITKVKDICEKAPTVGECPVVVELFNANLLGIVGDRKDTVAIAQNLILQVATHYSYKDIQIVTIYGNQEKNQWNWVKWLPHSYEPNRQYRYLAGNVFAADKLLDIMEEILKQRQLTAKKDMIFTPYYLFVFADMEASASDTVMKYILNREFNLGFSALFLYNDLALLPKECNTIIRVENGAGVVFARNNVDTNYSFKIDSIPPEAYEKFARALAPMRIRETGGEQSLPSNLTFLQGYGIRRPEELRVEDRWKQGKTFESMAVPIGIKGDGNPFLFDIHEKKYGPHGMVAGMTGSGKSEMVQTWILSMACQFSPRDVSFVLIDFKGTGLILPFKNLPHLAGTISDLDHKINRNLVALENEMSRRKALLDRYGVNNINAYLKLREQGKNIEPLGFLFIIIDEFAEFKVQFPDFMPVIDRIFAIGRTLGVFIMLLTQKPAGVVDDKMNANTRFRWCLKVASSADSKEMLHHPDAAAIINPGRAYVQVGEDEVYELIQSYYSGAVYDPDRDIRHKEDEQIAVVEEDGRKVYYGNQEVSNALQAGDTEIKIIVDYLKETVISRDMKVADQIWLPKLPARIFLDDIQDLVYKSGDWKRNTDTEHLIAVAGMVDDPAAQSQYPLKIDFTESGHIAVFGAPSTGKSTFLYTVIMSLIRSYSPEEVNLYFMDFGGWGLGVYKDFPHVGGIANDNDEEKIKKTVELINRILSERKEKFSEVGVGSLATYMETTGEKLPNIVLVLDNFAPVYQLYPDLDTFFLRLTREGGNYGVYFLVSGNTQMSLGFKLNQNIKMAFTLQMADKSEYASIVGKTQGLEPEMLDGRGLMKGNPPLEFQTALPAAGDTEGERVRKIRELAGLMGSQWRGKRAVPLPIMPKEIHYGDTGYEAQGCLGLDIQSLEPVLMPQNRKHYFPILGTPKSGKTNMLRLLAREELEYTANEIVVVDLKGSQPAWLSGEKVTWISESSELDQYMEQLVPELQRRKEAYDDNTDEIFQGIRIYIDDYRDVYEAITDKTAKRLEAVLRLGEGLNVFLTIAGDREKLDVFWSQGEGVCMIMAKEKTGILLGGRAIDCSMLRMELSGNEKSAELGAYEGYLSVGGQVVRFKTLFIDS